MKKILVLGGTGFVGRHVCEKLTRLSYRVTVPTRRRENAKLVQHLPRLDVLEANIHDPATLARLVAGHDAVINLVAILHGDEAAHCPAGESPSNARASRECVVFAVDAADFHRDASLR